MCGKVSLLLASESIHIRYTQYLNRIDTSINLGKTVNSFPTPFSRLCICCYAVIYDRIEKGNDMLINGLLKCVCLNSDTVGMRHYPESVIEYVAYTVATQHNTTYEPKYKCPCIANHENHACSSDVQAIEPYCVRECESLCMSTVFVCDRM